MSATTIAAALTVKKKTSRPKPLPPAFTPAEAMSTDLRHLPQGVINDRFKAIVVAQRGDAWKRDLFADRVHGPRLFKFIDLFCGAGGSSTGLTMAGGVLLKAFNHSQRNIDTHSENFRDADHECADINHYDMRNLPKGADVLWASPICTEISPAGGHSRDDQAAQGEVPEELLKYGPVAKDTFERTRATAYDVIRACETNFFPIVIVENVVEFCTEWRLFFWWLAGMVALGYEYQIVCANSAHISGPDGVVAPQSRDRLYIVFNRRDVAKPDVRVRPRSWCGNCDTEVRGVQTWKEQGYPTRSGQQALVGKYGIKGGQYIFTCPNSVCRQTVHPIIRPAASIINFHFIGEQIGGRDNPLVDNTRRRVRRGMLDHGFSTPPVGPMPFLDANGGSWNKGPASITAPFRTRTTKDWEGMVTPPGAFIDNVRNHGVASSVHDPFSTMAASGNHHGIVVPYNRTGVAFPTTEPLTTVTTNDRHGLLTGWDGAFLDPAALEELIDSSYYRMIQWYEQLLAQAFPLNYLMTGNIGERTAGAGNAVSCNAAAFFGHAAAVALNRTAALV
jgi:DNA (cytosine-5)-methyltransferase 1